MRLLGLLVLDRPQALVHGQDALEQQTSSHYLACSHHVLRRGRLFGAITPRDGRGGGFGVRPYAWPGSGTNPKCSSHHPSPLCLLVFCVIDLSYVVLMFYNSRRLTLSYSTVVLDTRLIGRRRWL